MTVYSMQDCQCPIYYGYTIVEGKCERLVCTPPLEVSVCQEFDFRIASPKRMLAGYIVCTLRRLAFRTLATATATALTVITPMIVVPVYLNCALNGLQHATPAIQASTTLLIQLSS